MNENNEYEIREFGSTTPDLQEISSWLIWNNVKIAAMEATGVYWTPLFEILEDCGIEATLIDPKTAKNVPGRKTDFKDAEWIHKLYSCGLLRPAFRPAKNKEPFRSYMRHRSNLIKSRQIAILHMNKALLLMNIKLESMVTDITSVTGMDIIRAIVKGERDPNKLAEYRNFKCKMSKEDFVKALTGNFQHTHLFSLRQSLETFDYFSRQIDECDKMINDELQTWPTMIEGPTPPKRKDKNKRHPKYLKAKKPDRNEFNFDMETLMYQKNGVDLTAINSVGCQTVAVIISELGGKEGLAAFPTCKHWCSWLTLCPGNNISGGKRIGGRSRKSKNRIKRALCTAAMSLCHSKCALGAYYRRMAARIGKGKALKAVAHKLAKIVYLLLKEGQRYVEIGQDEYERKYQERRLKNLRKSASELGYELVAA